MEQTTKLRKMIKDMLEKTSEPEYVKAISLMENEVDEIDKAYEDLETKHKSLKVDYSDFIKKQGFKSADDEEEKEEPESFESLANKFLQEKGEEF